jgi:hypothetical protein
MLIRCSETAIVDIGLFDGERRAAMISNAARTDAADQL